MSCKKTIPRQATFRKRRGNKIKNGRINSVKYVIISDIL